VLILHTHHYFVFVQTAEPQEDITAS